MFPLVDFVSPIVAIAPPGPPRNRGTRFGKKKKRKKKAITAALKKQARSAGVRLTKGRKRRVKKTASQIRAEIKRKKTKKQHSRKGRSNVRKYKGLSKKVFCGRSGKAAAGSYPVNSQKRCRAALSYARFAPYPCGIVKCAMRKAKTKRWNCGKHSKLVKKCMRKNTFGQWYDSAYQRTFGNMEQLQVADYGMGLPVLPYYEGGRGEPKPPYQFPPGKTPGTAKGYPRPRTTQRPVRTQPQRRPVRTQPQRRPVRTQPQRRPVRTQPRRRPMRTGPRQAGFGQWFDVKNPSWCGTGPGMQCGRYPNAVETPTPFFS